MYAYINGFVTDKSENCIILENNGIGYRIYTDSNTIIKLAYNKETRFYTYLNIKDDAMELYGFLSNDILSIFKQLISVSGIGPKGALGILSTLQIDELITAIISEDAKAIAKSPGIGQKTAKKVIIELKDKINPYSSFTDTNEESILNPEGQNEIKDIKKEAMEALIALGYSKSESYMAINKIDIDTVTSVEDVLKIALTNLVRI
ncbi:Holliday junction DNA helicase subunit RuvA [Acetitomaculum ruminis DSM 5522]|uniref:Holliday junction branch migration complex subunit RuvA n=1 Tax=Acetitomaculum ruminis DSM 5522 TaxID=1120918 RepID=A0A1I0VIJ2_9FIRM|nr:Holliday junction branch migration protein RuvA [Acetitomaculum ruminis]SFA76122.1 Holliday junction DNA helicase subunit RuvA [Acetitomaculum ruminis DSM 5522]